MSNNAGSREANLEKNGEDNGIDDSVIQVDGPSSTAKKLVQTMESLPPKSKGILYFLAPKFLIITRAI